MILTEPATAASSPERSSTRRTYLMCRPEYFTVSYSINPWMEPTRPTDTALALRQWQTLYDTYIALGHEVHLIDQHPDLPDMVYAANGGFTVDGMAYAARFAHEERAAEADLYADWFREAGFAVTEPREINEGEGDFLLVGDIVLAGSGFRSATDSHTEVAEIFQREVVGLTLVDPRFYHLDTAIAVLDPVTPAGRAADIAYYPGAFDERSRRVLEQRFPDAVLVAESDAVWLGLNAISDGVNVVIAARATGFAQQLRDRGYTPIGVDLSELLLGGGGVKCCTLELRQ